MWIRSQDKKVLCEYKEVYLGDHNDYYQIENDKWVLGEYSTEEKALKVLDMIEKHINGLNKLYIVQDRGNPNGYEVSSEVYLPIQNGKISIVFQMPQDRDV